VLAAALLLAAALFAAPSAALTLASAPPPGSALVGEGFVLLTDDKGIKVYRRDRKSGLEFAAEGSFAAAPERVRRVILDYPNHGKWQKHLKENRVLARGDGFLDVYQRMGLPVLDDRDYTLHVTWGDEGGVLWTRFVTANERGPAPVPGVVRVTQHEGAFRLEPVDGGKGTRAVYRFSIDIAGSFPAWMAKGQATSDITAYFVNVSKQLPGYP
jgi:hypothetical protein